MIVKDFFQALGKTTKLNLAVRDERIMNTFRQEALQVLDVAGWFEVLRLCDKYRADMRRKGRLKECL